MEADTLKAVALPGEGDVRKQVRMRRECDICVALATKRVSYLLDNARSNPASAAYCRDDCTWCSDAEAFACDAHANQVERDAPEGMRWAGTFDGTRPHLSHMLLYWEVSDG